MDDRSTHIDVTAWRVAPLSDDFADEVLMRIDDPVKPSSVDALDVLDALPDDEHAVLVPSTSQTRTHRTPRIAVGFVALAVAAAAVLVMWLARPQPVPSSSPAMAPVTHVAASPPDALDPEGIRRVVREQFQPAAKLCYDVLVINDAPGGPGAMERPYVSPHGLVQLLFAVTREGDRGIVVRAEIGADSEIVDEAFHSCLLAAIRKSVFEAPFSKDPVELEIPLVFGSPVDESAR